MISSITISIYDSVQEFRNRQLDAVYPIVYCDAIMLKVAVNNQIINMAYYIVLGVNIHGKKEILGIYASENEGAKFWLFSIYRS